MNRPNYLKYSIPNHSASSQLGAQQNENLQNKLLPSKTIIISAGQQGQIQRPLNIIQPVLSSPIVHQIPSRTEGKVIKQTFALPIRNFVHQDGTFVFSQSPLIQQPREVLQQRSQPSHQTPVFVHGRLPTTSFKGINLQAQSSGLELQTQSSIKLQSSGIKLPAVSARPVSFPKKQLIPRPEAQVAQSPLPSAISYKPEEVEETVINDENILYHTDEVCVSQRQHCIPATQKDEDLLKTRKAFADAENFISSLECNVEEEIQLSATEETCESFSHKDIPSRPKAVFSNEKIPTPGESDLSKWHEGTCDSTDSKRYLQHDEYDSESSLSDDVFVKKKRNTFKKKSKKNADKSDTSDMEIQDDIADGIINYCDKELLLKILPPNYDYKITSLKVSHNKFNHISSTFRVNIHNAMDAIKFKEDLEKSSKTNLRVKKTWGLKEDSKRISFKKKYRCHHDTLASKSGSKKAHEKHCECPATLVLTIKNKNMKWSKDEVLQSHPGNVVFNSVHNHSVDGSDILRHRRPAPEIVEKFTKMFTQKHPSFSPTSAMDAHLADLEMEDEMAMFLGTGDGAVVPTMSWLYKLYNKLCKERCGDAYGDGMIAALQKYIDDYNVECGEICAKMGTTSDGKQHYVAVCTPLMKRIHTQLPSSGEVMFMDASGNMDGCNARIFNIRTHSVAGGLPLGFLLTFCEDERVTTAALELWKTILPEKAFHGRGLKGPKIIMTDDSTAERNSLRSAFPDAHLLLCAFHVLQAMWRYIWDSKHGVEFRDRSAVYMIFHRILYAATIEEFEQLYAEAMHNELLSKHKIVKAHIFSLKSRAIEWAICHRAHIIIRGHMTNNIVEASFKILMDRILCRVKAFNPVELLYYLLTSLIAYYKRRLSFVINNRPDAKLRQKHKIPEEKLKPLTAEKLPSCNLYEVFNRDKNTKYLVDMTLEVCSCPVGCTGAPCKHQFCVAKTFNLSSNQFLPFNDTSTRALLFFIVMGHNNVPPGWFDTLNGQAEPVSSLSSPPSAQEVNLSIENNEDEPPSFEGDPDSPLHADTDGDDVSSQLREFAEDLAKRVSDSDSLKKPLSQFLDIYWKTVKRGNCESTLASGLSTFLREQTAPQKHLRRGHIPAQSTAPARRVEPGGGRTARKGGRPRGEANVAEHSYNVKQKNKRRNDDDLGTWAGPPKKKAKTPHNLMACVTASVMVPK